MLTFIPVATAFAADAPAKSPLGGIGGIAPLIILFVIFYFFLIRPQQKRAKEHKEMLGKVAPGDNIITTGGIHARVTQVGEETLTVEIADKVRVKISRSAVSIRQPKG